MRWSWKIAQVAGIGIYVHWSFLLIIAWIIFLRLHQGQDAAGVVEGVVFVLALFGCVVLHELGHALMAKRFGVRTRDITLLPIGGLARLERMPENPVHEFWIAVAGPAVNVVIAAALFGVLVVMHALPTAQQMTEEFDAIAPGGFLAELMVVNIVLVLFNMLPAFPMDGGRVLRAILAHFTGNYVGATQIAASVGQFMAILFGILGLFIGNPFLLFIALFVYLAANEEAHMVQVRSLMRGVPVRVAMMTRVRTVRPEDTLELVAQELLAGDQQDFPVVEGDQVVGMLHRKDALHALTADGAQRRVADCMKKDCGVVEDTEMLDATFERMQSSGCASLPVVRDGRLVGMVTLENVGEMMMIHSAMRQRGGQPNRGAGQA